MARSLTITTWSHMPGHVRAAGGGVAEDERDGRDAGGRQPGEVAEDRPPGMKISFWVGRSAPPDSTRLISGSRFSRAISSARSVFLSVHGLVAPPRTVGSLATDHALDALTTPMPVTTLAPTVKALPQAASGDSSRNGVSGSSSSSMRSRASSLPRSWWRSTYFVAAAGEGLGVLGVELGELGEHRLAVGGELGRLRVEGRLQDGHRSDLRDVEVAGAQPLAEGLGLRVEAGVGGDAVAEQPVDDEVERAQVRAGRGG